MSRTLKELLAQGAESATAVSAPGRPALSHGGLRRHSPSGDREPLCGKFVILGKSVSISAPMLDERNPDEAADPEDVAAIAELDPPPESVKDARERLQWRNDRTGKAFRAWKKDQP